MSQKSIEIYAPASERILGQSATTITVGNVGQSTEIRGSGVQIITGSKTLTVSRVSGDLYIDSSAGINIRQLDGASAIIGNPLGEHFTFSDVGMQYGVAGYDMTLDSISLISDSVFAYLALLQQSELIYSDATVSPTGQRSYTPVQAQTLASNLASMQASESSSNDMERLFQRRNVIYPATLTVFTYPYTSVLQQAETMNYTRLEVTAMTDNEYGDYSLLLGNLLTILDQYRDDVSAELSANTNSITVSSVNSLYARRNAVTVRQH